MIAVRTYQPSDHQFVEQCISQLQDFEGTLERDRVSGISIADKYLDYLLSSCADNEGQIYIAEVDTKLAGFAAVWLLTEDDLISDIKKLAYFSDMLVLPEFRGLGVSGELLKARENYVKSKGVKYIQMHVLAKNERMQHVAHKNGFRDYEITLMKELTD